MPQYLLLLYNEPNWLQKLSPEEMQKATEKYMAWMSKPFVGIPGTQWVAGIRSRPPQ